MKLQLLSDLHLETEAFTPQPAPGAELLVLAGDIDATWAGLSHFAGWPVPVIFVAGNHEFDGRDFDEASAALRARCQALGLTMLERESLVLRAASGELIRFLGTTRWSDFDAFGTERRAQAQRAAGYFVRIMQASRHGQPFDAQAVRDEALLCRAWMAQALAEAPRGRWQRTVAITHFAPSLRSADPRFGAQPGTASFCNNDDALLPYAKLWLHGHLHCRHDYTVAHGGGATRVVCAARGLASKGEAQGHDPLQLIDA